MFIFQFFLLGCNISILINLIIIILLYYYNIIMSKWIPVSGNKVVLVSSKKPWYNKYNNNNKNITKNITKSINKNIKIKKINIVPIKVKSKLKVNKIKTKSNFKYNKNKLLNIFVIFLIAYIIFLL
jgi:hypothetical protein